ncbi:bifunctional diguanylate cyclase/phosphodiesterase [Aliamphritea ceti]|uniref:bifunctional diguanylate cyclase/phosphodiesterase n=1 Tax=Aliamphritea ceti TaxID=1524258 RepID=UPI0021C42C62|nr:EAL domain-containing protein [Aliamphritea ceti]
MSLNSKHRIAFKQARVVLLISILLGLVSTGWQITLDLQQERRSLQAGIERILTLHRETASLAVYNLNQGQAEEITKALIAYPEIYSAKLVDDFGDPLAEHSRPQTESSWLSLLGSYFFRVETQIHESLSVDASANNTARLSIDLDAALIASSFASRAFTSLLFSLFYDVTLAAIFLILFYRWLSKPIENIVAWVNDLREGKEGQLPYTETDEIGDLVAGFSRLWEERKQVTDKLNETIQELSKSESFSRTLMDNAGDAMFLCFPDTRIVQVNNRAAQYLAETKACLLKRNMSEFSQNYSHDELVSLFASLDEQQVTSFEDSYRSKNGTLIPIEARVIKLVLEESDYLLIMVRDISVRKEAEKQIYDLAFFDPLTALPNRRLFMDRLTSSLELHNANHKFGAVLYLDLDRFKTVNDSLGHGVGDALLCEIANRIKKILPATSTCSRFGGDEFVVLLPEIGENAEVSAEIAANLALQVLEQIRAPFEVNSHTLYCSASIGISMFPDKSNVASDVLRCADTALYKAKALGRNCFQFFDPEMQSSAQQRLDVEKGLHLAVDNQELELWFQPQTDIDDKIIGAEALVRWNHPQRGLILPGEFIPVAEDSGQIIEVGEWVIAESLRLLAQWRVQGLPESFRRLSINISPLQFMQVNFVETLFALLDASKISGNMIELEITENMLLNKFEVASNKMNLLKQRGISFAIDDFGTGYSSLKYLRYLPLDVLKIDRSFVAGLRSLSEEAAIIEVIIATADRLDLQVIAEGVETKEERFALQSLGCCCFQGYLFSKPVPASQIYEMLQQSVETTAS